MPIHEQIFYLNAHLVQFQRSGHVLLNVLKKKMATKNQPFNSMSGITEGKGGINVKSAWNTALKIPGKKEMTKHTEFK